MTNFKNKNINAEKNSNQIASLTAELTTQREQAAKMQVVAQEAVNRLIFIENKLSPQLLRKPSFWNVLFHWKEVVAVIVEIITIIKNFRDSLQPKTENDSAQ